MKAKQPTSADFTRLSKVFLDFSFIFGSEKQLTQGRYGIGIMLSENARHSFKPPLDTYVRFWKIDSFISVKRTLTVAVIKSITGLDGGQEQQKIKQIKTSSLN